MAKRREFSTRVRIEAFLRCQGHCEGCGALLHPARYHLDHVIPDAMGGEPTLSNCRVICLACHGTKTKRDVADVARAVRRQALHLGVEKPSKTPLPCGKRSRWKRKISGEVVKR